MPITKANLRAHLRQGDRSGHLGPLQPSGNAQNGHAIAVSPSIARNAKQSTMRGAPVFHSIRLPAGQASRVHGEEAVEAHANDGEIGALPNGRPSGPSPYRGTVDSARMQRTNLRHTPLFPSSGWRECSHFR